MGKAGVSSWLCRRFGLARFVVQGRVVIVKGPKGPPGNATENSLR